MKRLYIIAHGTVQGVFFRHNARKKAQELGLKGYVKNLPDETVEIVAEGDENKLKELVDFCKNHPGASKVSDVKVSYEDAKNEFEDFEVRY